MLRNTEKHKYFKKNTKKHKYYKNNTKKKVVMVLFIIILKVVSHKL